MATVLLVDDERLFKAVEGTCLRREGCRLLKASPSDLPAVALARRPDLILAAAIDDASRELVLQLGSDRSIGSIPILVLDMTPARAGAPSSLPGQTRALSA